MKNSILHLDMDAFYASVEQRDQPELQHQPVIVGGSRERGVVSACSYEARSFGVHSAMPISRALRLCPQAHLLPVRMAHYREISRQIFAIFGRYTDRIEALSIDEGFLDVSGCERLFGTAVQIGERIRREVRAETGLAVSGGVAPNKFLAKLASQQAKPDGLLEILPEQVDRFLLPLPVERLWGVGGKTAQQLHRLGCQTVADLRHMPENQLKRMFGVYGERLYRLARGEDTRTVEIAAPIKSMGAEETFSRDLQDLEQLRRVLLAQAEKVALRLRRQGLAGRCLTLKIRYHDFSTQTRRLTLSDLSANGLILYRAGTELLHRTEAGRRPVRLLGLTLSGLEAADSHQAGLFPDEDRQRLAKLDLALDQLSDRFGGGRVRRASLLETVTKEEKSEP
ncbi:MAG: DNA polymerase IV [Desulfuromonadaceae bacterium]